MEVGLTGEHACVLAVRFTAERIDDSFGEGFITSFLRKRTRLDVGDPVPIVRPDWPTVLGRKKGLTSRPETLGRAVPRVRYLGLVPEVRSGHEVVLDLEHADEFPQLSHQTVFGFLIPNGVDSCLEFDRIEDTGRLRFFNVRPRDGEGQWRTIVQLLEEAREHNAAVVILPELSLDEATLQAVAAWHRRVRSPIGLLVAGSVHATDGKNVRRNTSTAFFGSGRWVTHHKFNPYVHRIGADELHEDIATTPSAITVHACSRWSFTILICKDLLEPPVAPLLRALGVNVVLVPALSRRTEELSAAARQVAMGSQCLVAIANAADPSADGTVAACALLALPLRKKSNEAGEGDSVLDLGLRVVLREDHSLPIRVFFHGPSGKKRVLENR